MKKIISLLTPRQEQFYQLIKSAIKKDGQSPTVAELMKAMKVKSPRAVTQYLMVLERKGLIARARYARRGIRLLDTTHAGGEGTVTIPVIASAGCDNVSVLAEQGYEDFVCVSSDLLHGVKKDKVVGVKAIGNSMVDAGLFDGDYVLVETTQAVADNDLVVAIIDSFAVIKKIEYANNAVVLKPVSSDPMYRPIILRQDFKIFGKVIDTVKMPQKGDLEIVPLYG